MKYYTDEQKEVFKFIIIIVVLVLVIGGIYLITDKYIEKGSRNTTTGTVNYDKATIGTMLNVHMTSIMLSFMIVKVLKQVIIVL